MIRYLLCVFRLHVLLALVLAPSTNTLLLSVRATLLLGGVNHPEISPRHGRDLHDRTLLRWKIVKLLSSLAVVFQMGERSQQSLRSACVCQNTAGPGSSPRKKGHRYSHPVHVAEDHDGIASSGIRPAASYHEADGLRRLCCPAPRTSIAQEGIQRAVDQRTKPTSSKYT